MVDLEFTEAVATALASSVTTALKTAGGSELRVDGQSEQLQVLCRRAARQLLFDLDGQVLLDLALKKLETEHDLKSAGLREPFLVSRAS